MERKVQQTRPVRMNMCRGHLLKAAAAAAAPQPCAASAVSADAWRIGTLHDRQAARAACADFFEPKWVGKCLTAAPNNSAPLRLWLKNFVVRGNRAKEGLMLEVG